MNKKIEEINKAFNKDINKQLKGKIYKLNKESSVIISNKIAKSFIVNVFQLYENIFQQFTAISSKKNNIILVKILSETKILLAEVLISIKINNDEIVLTNLISTIKYIV